jgi:RNA recognition motif-containing protein
MDIYVGNLAGDVTESDLREAFEPFGRVETADVVRRHRSEGSRGFGFVAMSNRSEGVCAVLSVHGRTLKGRAMTASKVRPEDPVSGACRTRCSCRRTESPTRNARPILAASIRERRTCDTDENGLDWGRRGRGLPQTALNALARSLGESPIRNPQSYDGWVRASRMILARRASR